jgi:adenosylcobinamide kinase / adenosylcobinamide-phosphate guanylyltransferase
MKSNQALSAARGLEPRANHRQICFITGGARSGKSNYAQQEALKIAPDPLYIATARRCPEDEDFSQRIQRHIADRDQRWTCIEEPLYLGRLPVENRVVVIDCVTLWISNIYSLYKQDEEQSLKEIKTQINSLQKQNARFFIISNEIGMGLHAETAIGRKFTDLQGWTNQWLGSVADKVVLMISGIPLLIKNPLYFPIELKNTGDDKKYTQPAIPQ